jgi:hypothetical protein
MPIRKFLGRTTFMEIWKKALSCEDDVIMYNKEHEDIQEFLPELQTMHERVPMAFLRYVTAPLLCAKSIYSDYMQHPTLNKSSLSGISKKIEHLSLGQMSASKKQCR